MTAATVQTLYFPLPALRAMAAAGVIGALTTRFHGVPTNRNQQATLAVDGPELLRRCLADGADAAVLVANCPVCHQTLSLCALEAAGISTVVMGCAKDIVEYVGVPRLLFSDFPLGNAAGRPGDAGSQQQTLTLALQLLAQGPGPRCTLQSAQRWHDHAGWKADYGNAARLSAPEIERRRAEFDRGKSQASQLRQHAGLKGDAHSE